MARVNAGPLRRCGLQFAAALVALVATLFCAPARSQEGKPPKSGNAEASPRRSAPGNLVGHGGPVKAIRVAPSGTLAATGAFDYAMMIWDLGAERPVVKFRVDRNGGAINAVAFTPDAKRALAAGDDGGLSVFDLATGVRLAHLEGHTGKVSGIAVSPDGRSAATASWDHTARLWDLEALRAGPLLSGHKGPVNAVVFSADGGAVYTASADGTIGAWSRATGEFDRPLYTHGWGINVLARVGGTRQLVFGALNGSVAIIDAADGSLVRELAAHARPILALDVIDKPALIATGGGDGVVRVMRAADGAVLEEHKNAFGPVWALAFTADGKGLYYGGLDDFATLWTFAPRQPFEPVDSTFPRRFQVRGQADSLEAKGELQFARKCSVCHTLTPDGGNRAGPSLHGVFGRRIATLPGYPFSEPLKKLEIVWSEASVAQLFELGPDVLTPGSKMPLQRMTDKAERDALIAFLRVATTAAVDPAAPPGQGSSQQGAKP